MSQPRRVDPSPFGGQDGLPYSKGVMARALIATGVRAVRAYELASRVEQDLRTRGASFAELDRLRELAVEILGERDGRQAVERLVRYNELRRLELPIIVLVGGATGTGKSTIATEVVFADNEIVPLDGQPDLDALLRELAAGAVSSRAEAVA